MKTPCREKHGVPLGKGDKCKDSRSAAGSRCPCERWAVPKTARAERLSMADVMNVAIIGASGYSGAELAGLLLKHPGVRLNTLMTANQERQDAKPRKYSEELPQF